MEDQTKINKFSRYNIRRVDIADEIAALEREVQAETTACEELEVLIEDQVHFQLGGCFMLLDTQKASDILEKQRKAKQGRLKEITAERLDYGKMIAELKTDLYSKFGNRINLEA